MGMKLIRLTKEYERQLGEMIDEWKEDQERNHTNHSPWAIFKNDYRDFDYYLAHLEHKTEENGRVPDSVFFLLDEERDRLLGAVNIRHYLNEELLKEGGHIGDGIRPSERRKGHATEMIRLALAECRKLGIDRVLMTCDKENIGSAKSIMKNGGVLENEFVNSDGEIEQRYWIDLQKKQSSIVIETERLILREMNEEDLDALYAVLGDSDIMQHYPHTFDEARVREWIRRNQTRYQENGFGLWAVCLKETGEMIGDCGLTLQRIDGQMLPEIGYHIRANCQRRGYAREAAAGVRDWAFTHTEYDALYSYCKYTNLPSYRTAEAIGMRFLKEYPDEANEITHVSVMTRADWEALKKKV